MKNKQTNILSNISNIINYHQTSMCFFQLQLPNSGNSGASKTVDVLGIPYQKKTKRKYFFNRKKKTLSTKSETRLQLDSHVTRRGLNLSIFIFWKFKNNYNVCMYIDFTRLAYRCVELLFEKKFAKKETFLILSSIQFVNWKIYKRLLPICWNQLRIRFSKQNFLLNFH